MSIQKVYYTGGYLRDESCDAYFGEDYNFYEGNDFDYNRDKLKGCIAGEDYEYIHRFPCLEDCENFRYPICNGYIRKSEEGKGCYEVYEVDSTESGIYYECIGWLVPGQATDSKGIRRSEYDILGWRPEYAGWMWVGFTDGIPAVGAAYIVLMRNDSYFWKKSDVLYYQGKCWKIGEPKPAGTPDRGTKFRRKDTSV